MRDQYHKRGMTQSVSRGRGQRCSWDMNSTSFSHQGGYGQSIQNQTFMYPTDRMSDPTQLGTLPHHYQMSAPPQEWHHVSATGRNPNHNNWKRMGQQDTVRLSKTLAFLLRHGAEKLGFHFMPGGFLYVDELLKYHKPLWGVTVMQIQELVRTDDWQQFALQVDYKGRLMIRANQGHSTAGQQDTVRLSKTLAFLLRHGAEKLGFHFMPGGFLYVDELLKYHKPLRGATVMQIQELVRTNDKQRFALQVDDKGRLMIRANQGHSTAVESLDLTPISDTSEVEMVVHGTYYQAWEQIQNTGLSRMNRNHIHFAAGMPGENGVISGMRKSCEVVIEIDLENALKAGIPFFRSANNVILSPGNENGFIPPTFFKSAFDRHTRKELLPMDFLRRRSSFGQDTSSPSVHVTGEGMKRMREELSEDEYDIKRRKHEPKLGSEKKRSEKEGVTSKSGASQVKKNDGERTESTKPQKKKKKKDKEMAKEIRLKDEKVDRGTSRSDRSKTEKEGVAKSHNETEKNMARQKDKTEEITKSHSEKGNERARQMRREDEKEVEESSKYRSREGKGEK